MNDDGRWQKNWWEFHPLVEDVRRPIAWSSSSTVFTAHPTQPIVIGRLFPSSKQYLVVSPEPILHRPASYGPPSVIGVSPNDLWLFAFFPSYEGDGIACLWNRGPCINAWMVKEYWSFGRGAGVITCAWAGTEREWSTSVDGSSYRLPSRGPLTPVSSPTLLLVTQAHQLHVCYLRTYFSPLKMLLCSLTQPYFTAEGQPLSAVHDTPVGPKTSKLCIYAAIGFIYRESSILVAMRSRRFPNSDSLKPAAHNDLDLDISLDISQSQETFAEEDALALEWGALAEEQTIELCEVKLRFDGMFTSLISHPLPPLHHPFPHISGLAFVCSPPPKLDPAASPRTSPKRDKQPIRPAEPPSTFLVATFLDFEDYSTIPKSTIVSYALTRASSPTLAKAAWAIHQVGERSFSPRVLTLSCPAWVSINPRKRGLIAMLADANGPIPVQSQKAKEVVVGNIVVLRLPELVDDSEWEQLPIMVSASRVGVDWPVNLTASRNQVLLCARALGGVSIYTLPKQLPSIPVSADPASRNISPLSVVLATALQSRRSIADIAHVLSVPAVPLNIVVDAIRGAWLAFEMNERACVVGAFSAADVMGATVELYRARARVLTDDEEGRLLTLLWRNIHDMCSIVACIAAFEDCKELEGYDLEAVWQLVSLSRWVINFLERLVKECLMAADLTDPALNTNELQPKLEPVDDADVSVLDTLSKQHPLSSPILLHLAHELTLSNLFAVVVHVNRFYNSLNALTPKRESSQIARDILMDTIGCSGLNLRGMEEILKGAMSDVITISGDEARMSLSKCQPVPTQHPILRKVIHTLYTSRAIDKPRLFIKAADLIDGFASLSTLDQPGNEQDVDVVTKGVLMRRNPGLLCLRCGFRSEMGGEVSVAGHVSLRWRTWEKMWGSRCVCGGAWISGDAA